MPDPAEPAPADALVTIRGVVLGFRGLRVLDGIDCDLRAGETLALLGPNGAGKSTLMRLVAGRLAPTAGTVRVAGQDPHRRHAARRAIGWVPQEIALYPRLTVAENLSVFAQLAGIDRRGRREAVAEALDLCAIADVARRPVGLLSGGYQRRVNIAASLMARPRLVLLDEPTQGIDLHARAAIHAVLGRLRAQGTALLLATHDFAEAERLADRVAILCAGRIVRRGRIADLLARLRAEGAEHEVALSAPADTGAEAALRRAGFAPVESGLAWVARGDAGGGPEGAALLAVLRERGVPVAEIRIRAPGLEAVYREALAAPAAADALPQRGTEAVAS